ncbi:TPA: hypothetical protein NR419_002753 [Listeria innocua]|nr:hypothetical protein [Listeria innocua]
MVTYAYKNEDRSENGVILAKDAQEKHRKVRYYCPNPDCPAELYICSLDGEKDAYFSANSSIKHIDQCWGAFKNNKIKLNEYTEELFEFEDALINLMKPISTSKKDSKGKNGKAHDAGDSKLKPLRTIQQIYEMCKLNHIKDTYIGTLIGYMLLDNRSEYLYSKGIYGFKLVECTRQKPNFYNNEKKELFLVAPKDIHKFKLILQFENLTLFTKLKNSYYSNRDATVIVAGNWSYSKERKAFLTKINSAKQFKILK